MIRRTLAVMRKEALHIIRDKRTMGIMLVMPVVELLLFGYAVTTDVKHLPMAVLDQDHSRESRQLADAYRYSRVFDMDYLPDTVAEFDRLIDSGQARAGLLIGRGYGEDLTRDGRAQVSFIVDGSDPTVASTALAAAAGVGQAQSAQIIQAYAASTGRQGITQLGLEVRPRVWYNPGMVSANFMVPALIGFILQVLTTMLTALSIVREKEIGTMEQLIVTPVQPLELILGKVLPYVVVALLVSVEILLVGSWWFSVPINGSAVLLLALGGVFLLSSLGLGILVSSVAHTQQEAMFLAFFTMFPAIFLSGFMFPLASMPEVLQALSYGVPLRYFLVIDRGIVLKGNGIDILWPEVAALAVLGVLILGVASARFRKRLG